jgi:hypothetical protein
VAVAAAVAAVKSKASVTVKKMAFRRNPFSI